MAIYNATHSENNLSLRVAISGTESIGEFIICYNGCIKYAAAFVDLIVEKLSIKN